MEQAVERSGASVGAVKGRPKKGTKSLLRQKNIVVANLSEQNMQYLRYGNEETRRSYANLLNAAVEHARKTDYFSQLDSYEPASIKKARELLEKWSTGTKPALTKKARAKRERSNVQ